MWIYQLRVSSDDTDMRSVFALSHSRLNTTVETEEISIVYIVSFIVLFSTGVKSHALFRRLSEAHLKLHVFVREYEMSTRKNQES